MPKKRTLKPGLYISKTAFDSFGYHAHIYLAYANGQVQIVTGNYVNTETYPDDLWPLMLVQR